MCILLQLGKVLWLIPSQCDCQKNCVCTTIHGGGTANFVLKLIVLNELLYYQVKMKVSFKQDIGSGLNML